MTLVKANAGSIHPLLFAMPAVDENVDLETEEELQFKKANGANIANGNNLFRVQNLIHTKIKQSSVKFSGMLISSQTGNSCFQEVNEKNAKLWDVTKS